MGKFDFSSLAESIAAIGKKLCSNPGEILPRYDERLSSFDMHIHFDGDVHYKIETISQYESEGYLEISRKIFETSDSPKIENAKVGDYVTVTYSDSESVKTLFGVYLGMIKSVDHKHDMSMMLGLNGSTDRPVFIPASLISEVKIKEAKSHEV